MALFFPIGAVVLAAVLFLGIKAHNSCASRLAAATPANLRSIVGQVLKDDLTIERLKDAFGTTAALNAAVCTAQPLPALPSPPAPSQANRNDAVPAKPTDPAKAKEEAGARRKQEAESLKARQIAAKTTTAQGARTRREGCRALLAARLSNDQSIQILSQIITESIVEPTLSGTFALNDTTTRDSNPSKTATEAPVDRNASCGQAETPAANLRDRDLSEATGKWLSELQRDAFTKRLFEGANATAGTMADTADGKSAATVAESVEMGLARVLSSERLEAALKRGLTADVRPTSMGNGVVGWSKDVAARLTWATMAFVFCAAFAFVMTAAFGQLRHVEESAAGRWQKNGYLATIILGVLVVVVPLVLGARGVTTGPLEDALLFFASRYDLHLGIAISVLDFIAVVGAVFLIVGSVATFLVEVRTAEEVKVQLSGLRTLFNAGVIFLLAGTLEVNALLRWPATFYPELIGQALIGAANWVSTAVGAVFTIVLLAVYLPSVSILHEQVNWLPPEERAMAEGAFATMGFGEAGSQQLSRLLQALAPLLTGLTLTATSML